MPGRRSSVFEPSGVLFTSDNSITNTVNLKTAPVDVLQLTPTIYWPSVVTGLFALLAVTHR